jgi:hypothetical protein
MRRDANWPEWIAAALCALGVAGCIIGAATSLTAFQHAWLCSYLFWLGLPLAGITLVLVHDLSGGNWMGTARPVLGAAAATMPIASLAGIPAFAGLNSIYSWAHPPPGLGNLSYLNKTDFFIRYGVYIALWNLLAAFVLWGPRQGRLPIRPALSWISGVGLVVLALSAGFAAIDWMMSLEPTFWSSAFLYAQSANWFNTGMAALLLTIVLFGWPSDERRRHMVDLSQILLATTIFWAYIEFVQFLIIWEENLKLEIPWYLKRLHSAWRPAIYLSAGLGFVIPFFLLLWSPSKRNRAIVGAVCVSILISRLAHTWLQVMPEFTPAAAFWLDVAAVFALGGVMVLLFVAYLRHANPLVAADGPIWTADRG